MTQRQIYDMDVIANACPVGRAVGVAIHGEMGQAADSHLGDVWYQIIGDAIGVFTDQAAGIRADRIESR